MNVVRILIFVNCLCPNNDKTNGFTHLNTFPWVINEILIKPDIIKSTLIGDILTYLIKLLMRYAYLLSILIV